MSFRRTGSMSMPTSPSKDGIRGMQARRDQVQAADVAWIRQQLNPQASAACPDAEINRFIRAANFNREQVCNQYRVATKRRDSSGTAAKDDKDAGLKRLNDTLAWKEEQQPDKIVCHRCRDRDDPHYMHVCGFDVEGRPILYSVFNLAENRGIEENRKHMLSTFEQAIRMMGPGVEQWVWFADFKGFGWQDCDPRLAQIFLDVSAKHYPERLGLFLIIDPPRIFRGLWRMLQPYIDPATKKKVAVLPYDFNKGNGSTALQLFNAQFSKQTTAWLMAEMKENRDRKIIKGKSYSYQDLVKPQYPLHPGSHDNRGTRELVECVAGNPRILLPMVDVGAARKEAGLGGLSQLPLVAKSENANPAPHSTDADAQSTTTPKQIQSNGYSHVHAEAGPNSHQEASQTAASAATPPIPHSASVDLPPMSGSHASHGLVSAFQEAPHQQQSMHEQHPHSHQGHVRQESGLQQPISSREGAEETPLEGAVGTLGRPPTSPRLQQPTHSGGRQGGRPPTSPTPQPLQEPAGHRHVGRSPTSPHLPYENSQSSQDTHLQQQQQQGVSASVERHHRGMMTHPQQHAHPSGGSNNAESGSSRGVFQQSGPGHLHDPQSAAVSTAAFQPMIHVGPMGSANPLPASLSTPPAVPAASSGSAPSSAPYFAPVQASPITMQSSNTGPVNHGQQAWQPSRAGPDLNNAAPAYDSQEAMGQLEQRAAGQWLSEPQAAPMQPAAPAQAAHPKLERVNMAQDSTRRLIDAQQAAQHQPLELLDLPPTLLARAQDTHRL